MSIPKLFKKAYKEKQFRKKLLKRLHIKEDRDYVASLFTFDPDKGKYVFSATPDKKAQKRLKTLAKAIRKNNGVFVAWKLALVLIVAAGTIGFNILFKNALLERLAEQALETVFDAPAKISGMDAKLLKGNISIASMEIGDKDRPGINLLQTGPAAFSIDTALALKKKLRIIEASVKELRTGTESSITGSWTREKKKKEDTAAKNEKPSVLPKLPSLPDLTGEIADFDYKGLIDEQKENLASYKILEQIKSDSEGMVKKWDAKLDESKQDIENITAKARELSSLNPSSLTDVSKLQSLQKELESGYSEVRNVESKVKGIRTELENDRKSIISRKNDVQKVFGQDYDMLKGLINLPTSEKLSLVSGYASGYIGPELQTYYGYVLKGMDALEMVKAFKQDKAKNGKAKKEERRYQEFVTYPSEAYPDLLIEKIEGSFAGRYSGEGRIEHISSDPELTKDPVAVNATFTGEGYDAQLNASADTRNDYRTFSMSFSLGGLPVHLDEGLDGLTLKSLDGKADGSLSIDLVNGYSDGSGVLKFVIGGTKITQTSGSGMIHDAIGSIFSTPVDIDAQGTFSVKDRNISGIRLNSSFDKVLSDRVGAYIGEKAKEMEKELRDEVNAYLEDMLKDYDVLNSVLSDEDAQALSQIRSVDDAKKLFEAKKQEAQNKVDAIVGELEKKKLEAEQQAKAEAERIKREAEEKARAEAEQRRKEAEAKAKEEANKIKDKVKIPGF